MIGMVAVSGLLLIAFTACNPPMPGMRWSIKIASGRLLLRYSMACSADSAMSTSMSYFSSMRLKITRADFESSTTNARLRAMRLFHRRPYGPKSLSTGVRTDHVCTDRIRHQAGSEPGASLFWEIHVSADSTSASSLAVKPSILTPVASAFFLASSALATVCIHTRPRRTLAVNFCCFSSVISDLLQIVQPSPGTIHDYGRYEEPKGGSTTAPIPRDPDAHCRRSVRARPPQCIDWPLPSAAPQWLREFPGASSRRSPYAFPARRSYAGTTRGRVIRAGRSALARDRPAPH